MNGQPGNPGTQALSLDQQVLGLFGNLSQEDQRQIKRQMIQTFTDMLQNKKGFLSSMEFIMAKANKPYEQKEKTSMVDQAEEFLKAPITDQELLALSKDLHINDVNGAIVKLDLQGQTTIGDITTDNAPSRYRNQNKLYFYHSM